MNKVVFVALASLALGAWATPTQTVGTARGRGGGRNCRWRSVGAVVGGAVGAVATAPCAALGGPYRYRCFWRDQHGYLHRRWRQA
jgi:hypothetical protein